jgi:4-amino-4-deoxy-L-arabinose transferase-like glycosyltransferase
MWRRAGVAALLVGTAVLYLWRITVNGMGNQFYAAAASAGSTNWEALLFGSLDSSNFITVDKPPLSQWVMGLSGQLFGFSSASMLIPQALMAVGSVWLLHAAVARVSGPWAGVLAGVALALTPVAALMFRYNNPDAAMVLAMTAATYCTVRALDRQGARWLALAGVALGCAFLAKMLEGLLVMPALAAAYLLAAPVRMRTRVAHLLGCAVAVVAASGWFVLLTMWWPPSSRPYLAGSTDNSFMNLVLGYNGVARILGRDDDVASAAPGTPAEMSAFGTQSHGWTRLLSGEFGYEIGWLVPAALLATALVIVARGRAPRTDRIRAAAVLFGGWLVVDGLVLSYMHGVIHPYYSLSIAPAVAAMFAIGVQQCWVRRETIWYRAAFAGLVLGTAVWSWWVLGRNAGWLPGLRWAVLVATAAAALGLLAVLAARQRGLAATLAGLAVVGALTGPGAYTVATIVAPHQGGAPSVGPRRTGHVTTFARGVDSAPLDAMLRSSHTPWSAAVDRSSNAAALELASDTAVMAIGGFSGTDPVPTLAQFEDDVAAHRVGYYVTTSTLGSHPGRGARGHTDIARWVAAHFPAQRVGRTVVYDLRSGPINKSAW